MKFDPRKCRVQSQLMDHSGEWIPIIYLVMVKKGAFMQNRLLKKKNNIKGKLINITVAPFVFLFGRKVKELVRIRS